MPDASLWHEGEGQSTVEYVAVLLGIIAIVVALSALCGLGVDGVLARSAGGSASHAIGGTDLAGALLDIFMY